MAHRTTILIDDATYEQLRVAATRRGVTVSDEVRAALAEHLATRGDTNAWFYRLAEAGANYDWSGPPIDHERIDELIRKEAAEHGFDSGAP